MGAARAVPVTGVRVRGSRVRVARQRIVLRGCERPGPLGGRQSLLALPHGPPARPEPTRDSPDLLAARRVALAGLRSAEAPLVVAEGHSERCRRCGCLITEVVLKGNQFRCFILFHFFFALVSIVFSFSDAKVLCLLRVGQKVPVCS